MKTLYRRIKDFGVATIKYKDKIYVECARIEGDLPWRNYTSQESFDFQIALRETEPIELVIDTRYRGMVYQITDEMKWQSIEVSDDFGTDYFLPCPKGAKEGTRLIVSAADKAWSEIYKRHFIAKPSDCPLHTLYQQVWQQNYPRSSTWWQRHDIPYTHNIVREPKGVRSEKCIISRADLRTMYAHIQTTINRWVDLYDWTHSNKPSPDGNWYTPMGIKIPMVIDDDLTQTDWNEILLKIMYFDNRAKGKHWSQGHRQLDERWWLEGDKGYCKRVLAMA